MSVPISFSHLAAAGALALAAAAAPLQAQPVGLPSMGREGGELTPMLEQRLGDAIMVQGRRDPTYIDDPGVRQYLGEVGRRLAAHAPGGAPEIVVFGVRDPTFNAFALPGGYIGVNSGLIIGSESESELAGVIAHEIGHVAQRHIARGYTQSAQSGTMMMATMAASLLAALAGGGDLAAGVAAFGQAATVSQQLSFSRDAEREADRAGFDMLRKAGYDPAGMAAVFGRLANASRLNEGAGGGAYASTHPLSLQRMSDIQNRLRMMPPARHVDSDDFWYVRAQMWVVQSGGAQSQRSARQHLQEEARALSGPRQAAAWYGLGLLALREGNLDQARKALEAARAGGRDAPQLAELAVRLAWAARDDARALDTARAAWRQWPDRRALAYCLAQALQRMGRHDEAVMFLRERVGRWADEEPGLYQLLAQSEDKAGQRVAARRSMARYYIAIGALPAAVSQLNQARGLSRDFYEQSQIDVQIREVKERMAEERELLERFKS